MAADQVRLLRHIEGIAKKQGNNICAECPERHPTWASLIKPAIKGGVILGVFVCQQCYKHHFKLGVSVCEVKSLTMATEWSEEEASILSNSGNKIVNSIYEAKNGWEDAKEIITFDRAQEAKLRYAYIQNKYAQRAYFSRQDYDEIMAMLSPSYKQKMEGKQNGASTTPKAPKNKVRRFSLTGGHNHDLNPDIRAVPRKQKDESSAGVMATPQRSTIQQPGNAKSMALANPLAASLHGTASKGGVAIPETPRTAARRRGGGHKNDIRIRQSGMLAAAVPVMGLQDSNVVLVGSNGSHCNNNHNHSDNSHNDNHQEMDDSSGQSLMERSLRGARTSSGIEWMDSSMQERDLRDKDNHNNNNDDSFNAGSGHESKNLMMLAMPSTLGMQPQQHNNRLGGYGVRRYSMGGSSDRDMANQHDNSMSSSAREGRTCGGSTRGQRTLGGGSMRGQRTLGGGSMRGQRSLDGGSMTGQRALDGVSMRGDRTLDNSRRGGRALELENSRRGPDRSESVTRRVRDGSLCRRRVDNCRRGGRMLDSSPAKNESMLETSKPLEASRRGQRTPGSHHRRTLSMKHITGEEPDMDWGASAKSNKDSRVKKEESSRQKTISTGTMDVDDDLWDNSHHGKSQKMDRPDPSSMRRKGSRKSKEHDDGSGNSDGSRKSQGRKIKSKSKDMDDGSGNSVSSPKSVSRKSKSKSMDDGSDSSRKSVSRKSKSKGLDGNCSSVSSRKSIGRKGKSKSFDIDGSDLSHKSTSQKSKKVTKSHSSDKLKKRTIEPLKRTSESPKRTSDPMKRISDPIQGRDSTKKSRFRRLQSEGDEHDSGSDSSDSEVEKRSSADKKFERTSKLVSKYSKNVPSSKRMMRSLSASKIESESETEDESDHETGRKLQRRHSATSLGSNGSLGGLDDSSDDSSSEDGKKPKRNWSKKDDGTEKYKHLDLASIATGGTLGALMTMNDQPGKKNTPKDKAAAAAAAAAAVVATPTSDRPKTSKKKQNPFRKSTGAIGQVAMKDSKKASEVFDMKNIHNAMVSQWMTNTEPKSDASNTAETSFSMDEIRERILKGGTSSKPDESSSIDKRKKGQPFRSSTASTSGATPLTSMMAASKKASSVGKSPKRAKSTGSSPGRVKKHGKDFKNTGAGEMFAALVKA